MRTVPSGVVVEFEEWDGEKFHVLRDSEDFPFRHLDQEQLFTLFRFGNVRGDEGVHEGLKIWSPPLCKAVTYFPFVVYAMCDTELLRVPRRGEAFVEAAFKTVDLIFARFKVIAGKFEKGIGDLQHENMGMAMIVNDKDSFYGATHSKVFIIIL